MSQFRERVSSSIFYCWNIYFRGVRLKATRYRYIRYMGCANNTVFSSSVHYSRMNRQVFSIIPHFQLGDGGSVKNPRSIWWRRSGEKRKKPTSMFLNFRSLWPCWVQTRFALCRFHSYPDLCDWSQGRWRWFPHQWSFIYILRVLPRNVVWLIRRCLVRFVTSKKGNRAVVLRNNRPTISHSHFRS